MLRKIWLSYGTFWTVPRAECHATARLLFAHCCTMGMYCNLILQSCFSKASFAVFMNIVPASPPLDNINAMHAVRIVHTQVGL